MIDIDNQSDVNLPIKTLTSITDSLTQNDVELLVVNEEQMRSINAEHRGIDKATDVLSFPLENIPMAPLGTIIINTQAVKTVAKALGHTLEDEFTLLYIHGLLHLLGYDHEVDKGEMRDKEEAIIRSFNLPQSLIIRTQESL